MGTVWTPLASVIFTIKNLQKNIVFKSNSVLKNEFINEYALTKQRRDSAYITLIPSLSSF